ncbi:MAG TPA: DNA mismatch repair endonuclease MutL, partial [Deltaproteobacteria bacterium]|nr:DNA mismatch repair endonuclease MutL [Deltaproteobacteria bacterium]
MAGNAPAVIRLMSESLASKIAAGEVVERPASVVKELVENALDAAAAHIAVLCEEGGRRLIRVTDDGSGIGEADAPLLLVRHATSKIRDEEDLEAITTMGFRGEALSSIAAVARLRIRTRTRESVSGVEVRAEDGEVTIVEAGCAPGTTVEVRDLFHNTPARRKFLRTAGTEFGHVMETVRRAALAHADKSFRLVHGGKTVFNCPPSSLADRVARLMGEEVLEGMGEVDARAMGPKGLDIRGIVGRPELTYPAPKALYTYINGRPVRDRTVTRAVLDGYGGLVAAGRYPAAVIFIDMPPSEVDVNVHPAKTEVRLRDGSAVYRAVRAAVERALRRGGGGGGG